MYLVYIGDDFFGNTYSKQILKQLKKIYPTAHAIHIDPYDRISIELDELTADLFRISLYYLNDRNNDKHVIVSTEYTINEASIWLNQVIISKLTYNNFGRVEEIYRRLPKHIIKLLGDYHPIENEVIASEDGNLFDLTYEGYMLYLSRDKRLDGDLY